MKIMNIRSKVNENDNLTLLRFKRALLKNLLPFSIYLHHYKITFKAPRNIIQ